MHEWAESSKKIMQNAKGVIIDIVSSTKFHETYEFIKGSIILFLKDD